MSRSFVTSLRLCYSVSIISFFIICPTHIYKVHLESIQPCNTKNRDIYWKEYNVQETVRRTMMPQSPSKWAPWDLTQFSQLPSASLLYFSETRGWSEISSTAKVILVLGKARNHRAPNLGCSGAESPGWFDVFQKRLFIRCDAWVGALSW